MDHLIFKYIDDIALGGPQGITVDELFQDSELDEDMKKYVWKHITSYKDISIFLDETPIPSVQWNQIKENTRLVATPKLRYQALGITDKNVLDKMSDIQLSLLERIGRHKEEGILQIDLAKEENMETHEVGYVLNSLTVLQLVKKNKTHFQNKLNIIIYFLTRFYVATTNIYERNTNYWKELCQSLEMAKNKMLARRDVFNDFKKRFHLSKHSFSRLLVQLEDLGYIEKINVELLNSNKESNFVVCLRLLKEFDEEECRSYYEKKSKETPEIVSFSGVNEIHLDHQVYKQIVDSKEEGILQAEIFHSLNMPHNMTEKIIVALVRDGKVIQVFENIGRTRGYRLYAKMYYEGALPQENDPFILSQRERCNKLLEILKKEKVMAESSLRSKFFGVEKKNISKIIESMEKKKLIKKITVCFPSFKSDTQYESLILLPDLEGEEQIVRSFIDTLKDKSFSLNPYPKRAINSRSALIQIPVEELERKKNEKNEKIPPVHEESDQDQEEPIWESEAEKDSDNSDSNMEMKNNRLIAMRKNGYVSAKIIRTRIFHYYLCQIFKICEVKEKQLLRIGNAVRNLPLNIFLQIIGTAEAFPPEITAQKDLRLEELPANIRAKFFQGPGLSHKLNSLIETLTHLGLVSLDEENNTYLEKKVQLEDNRTTSPVFFCFTFDTFSSITKYWSKLEYLSLVGEARNPSLQDLYFSKNWTSPKIIRPQRLLLSAKIKKSVPSEEEAESIANECRLTISQVISFWKQQSKRKKFFPDQKKRKKQKQTEVESTYKRKNWSPQEDSQLLQHFLKTSKDLNPRNYRYEDWKPIAKVLNRTPHRCQTHFNILSKKRKFREEIRANAMDFENPIQKNSKLPQSKEIFDKMFVLGGEKDNSSQTCTFIQDCIRMILSISENEMEQKKAADLIYEFSFEKLTAAFEDLKDKKVICKTKNQSVLQSYQFTKNFRDVLHSKFQKRVFEEAGQFLEELKQYEIFTIPKGISGGFVNASLSLLSDRHLKVQISGSNEETRTLQLIKTKEIVVNELSTKLSTETIMEILTEYSKKNFSVREICRELPENLLSQVETIYKDICHSTRNISLKKLQENHPEKDVEKCLNILIENKLINYENENYEERKKQFLISPWLLPSGAINENLMNQIKRKIVIEIFSYPGISEQDLLDYFHPYFSNGSIQNILQILELEKKISKQVVNEPIPTLFDDSYKQVITYFANPYCFCASK